MARDRRDPGAAHDGARNLGEQALDDLAHGRAQAADRHVAEAKRLDPGALREIVEAAGFNPDAARNRPA